MNPCRCKQSGRLWCWLDWALRCKSRYVCDTHDAHMRLERFRDQPPVQLGERWR